MEPALLASGAMDGEAQAAWSEWSQDGAVNVRRHGTGNPGPGERPQTYR